MHFRGTNIEFSIRKALFLTSLCNCHFCLPVFFFVFFLKWYNFFVLNLQVGSQNNEVVMYSLVFLIVKFYSKG